MREVTNEELNIIHNQLFGLLKAFRDICEKEGIFYSLCAGTMLGAVRHDGFIPWDTDADVMIWLSDKDKFREAFKRNKPAGISLRNKDEDPKCMQSHDTLYYEEKQIVEGIHLDIYPMVGAPSQPKWQWLFAKYTYYIDRIIRSKYKDVSQSKKKNQIPVAIVKAIDSLIPDKLLKRNVIHRERMFDFEKADHIILLACYGRQQECMPKSIWDNMIDKDFEGEKFKIPSRYDEYLTRIYGDYMTPKKY